MRYKTNPSNLLYFGRRTQRAEILPSENSFRHLLDEQIDYKAFKAFQIFHRRSPKEIWKKSSPLRSLFMGGDLGSLHSFTKLRFEKILVYATFFDDMYTARLAIKSGVFSISGKVVCNPERPIRPF